MSHLFIWHGPQQQVLLSSNISALLAYANERDKNADSANEALKKLGFLLFKLVKRGDSFMTHLYIN
ncbi:MAG: hypothetical protein E7K04_05510 [Helicobacter sp.]|nr:hypothetical protein [Helicobacter sp.]